MVVLKKKTACLEEDDIQASRPWWEPPFIIYGFSLPRVKSRLEKLMGTYIVRVTDREFMLKLQLRRREVHKEQVKKNIHDRELAEVEREKWLILEGKMKVEEAPAELANHPVFRITQLAKEIILARKLKEKKQKRHKKLKTFDYSLLEGLEEEIVDDIADMISCLDPNEISEEERERKLRQQEEDIKMGYIKDRDVKEGEGEEGDSEEGDIEEGDLEEDDIEDSYIEEGVFTAKDYDRIKYADPLVLDMQYMDTVDELYGASDEIVGPILGRTCGGMVLKRFM